MSVVEDLEDSEYLKIVLMKESHDFETKLTQQLFSEVIASLNNTITSYDMNKLNYLKMLNANPRVNVLELLDKFVILSKELKIKNKKIVTLRWFLDKAESDNNKLLDEKKNQNVVERHNKIKIIFKNILNEVESLIYKIVLEKISNSNNYRITGLKALLKKYPDIPAHEIFEKLKIKLNWDDDHILFSKIRKKYEFNVTGVFDVTTNNLDYISTNNLDYIFEDCIQYITDKGWLLDEINLIKKTVKNWSYLSDLYNNLEYLIENDKDTKEFYENL
jgi:hypothetical protein